MTTTSPAASATAATEDFLPLKGIDHAVQAGFEKVVEYDGNRIDGKVPLAKIIIDGRPF